MYTNKITDLFTLYGSFARVEGKATQTENGFTYQNEDVALTSETVKHPSGVFERKDTVKNVSDRPIEISVALSRFTLNGGEYQVYTQTNKHIREGIGGWQLLVSGVFGSADEIRTNQDVNPFVAVYNEQSRREPTGRYFLQMFHNGRFPLPQKAKKRNRRSGFFFIG